MKLNAKKSRQVAVLVRDAVKKLTEFWDAERAIELACDIEDDGDKTYDMLSYIAAASDGDEADLSDNDIAGLIGHYLGVKLTLPKPKADGEEVQS